MPKYKPHLVHVTNQPCILTGAVQDIHAHHLMRAEPGIMGGKVSDEFTVPLHYTKHDALHRLGNEKKFFEQHGWDYDRVLDYARRLWIESGGKDKYE
jgi:hypothetical protein